MIACNHGVNYWIEMVILLCAMMGCLLVLTCSSYMLVTIMVVF